VGDSWAPRATLLDSWRRGASGASALSDAAGNVDTSKVNESPRDPQIARLVVLASELSARVDEQSLAIGDVKAQLNGLWMTSGSADGEVTWTFRRRKSKIGFERSA
jgi:hypothetical protein